MPKWKLFRGLPVGLVFSWFALAGSARAAFHEPVDASVNDPTGHSAFTVGVADVGGAPGVVWEEISPAELHVAKLGGGAWTRLGAAVSTSANESHPPSLSAVAGVPIVAWTESTLPGPPAEQVEAAQFNGSTWTRLAGTLGSPSSDNTFLSSITTLSAQCSGSSPCPFLAYGEQKSDNSIEVHVATHNGAAWSGLGGAVTSGMDSIQAVQLVQGTDAAYVAWWDTSANTAHVDRLSLNPFLPVWVDSGLGASGAGPPSMTTINGTPYVTWRETVPGGSTIHIDRWDSATFTFKPVGSPISVPNKLLASPTITGVAGTPYVAYDQSELSGPPQSKVVVARFDGNNWVQVGGFLNHDLSNNATGPQIITVGGVPYVAWLEQRGPAMSPYNDLRVAGYLAPSCSRAAVSVGHDTPASVPLSCSDGSVDTLRLLQGPSHGSVSAIANGAVTYTPLSGYAGTDSFTYTGNDGASDAPAATITLTVAAAGVGPSGGGSRVAAKVSRLGLAKTFRAASRGPSVVTRLPTSHTQHAIGSAVTFTLNAAARVVFTVQAERSGVRRDRRCVAGRPTRRTRCTRFVPVRGSFTITGAAGRNRLLFSGRVGSRALGPAVYRLLARPIGGATVHADFRIARR